MLTGLVRGLSADVGRVFTSKRKDQPLVLLEQYEETKGTARTQRGRAEFTVGEEAEVLVEVTVEAKRRVLQQHWRPDA